MNDTASKFFVAHFKMFGNFNIYISAIQEFVFQLFCQTFHTSSAHQAVDATEVNYLL